MHGKEHRDLFHLETWADRKEIANFLGDCFRSRDWEVYVTDLTKGAGTPEIRTFSAVLIGGPVYRERYLSPSAGS